MADVKPKRKTTTSSKVKNRYNKKAYDNIPLRVYKGNREVLKDIAAQNGLSLNKLFIIAINEYLTAHGYAPVMVKTDEQEPEN